ncbi:DNA-binding protein [Robiginitalea marina]|uniref:DNA-binding protein n=1 Tax=Robiginitalea marina TaxID=2954105 RepID=A0ABT1AVE7_9FLAO|nr:DNA-binding protein [Robiginitalea marina]MCO5723582.1 DNA-binding protein [Robiginitalea marina]
MKTIKHVERLQQLHNLIQMECTGSPGQIANRLRISERTVYYLIEQLKDYEAQIGYDRSRRTYFYKDDFILEVNFSICIGTHDQVTEILEGSYFKNSTGRVFDRNSF